VQEEVKKLALKSPSTRQDYLDLIDRLLEVCFTKAMGKYCRNTERIAWIRAITGLVKAGSEVLSDSDIEDLLLRVLKLEEGEKNNVKGST
jgi:hypothetical protein